MIGVDIYTKRECCLCDEAKAILLRVQRDLPFALREVDIESTPILYEQYKDRIPVVVLNGRLAFKFRVDEISLRARLVREGARPGRSAGR